jgi:hypothetical protein
MEPKRIICDVGASAFQRQLLSSMADERPAPNARNRTLAALGIAPVALPTAGDAGARAPTVTKLTMGSTVGKIGVAGVIALGAALTMTAARSEPSSTVESSTTPRQVAQVDRPMPPPPRASASMLTTPAQPVHARSENGKHTAHAPTSKPGAPPSAHASLEAQLALVTRAREALSDGQAGLAIARLDEYDARWKGGTFAQDVAALRVDALVALGDRSGAAREGARFVTAYPRSPHASRIRTLTPEE